MIQFFLAQGIGNGIGGGMLFVPTMAAVAQHFHNPQKRALALGIVASGSGVGSIVLPILLNNLFKGSAGFKGGVLAASGLISGLQFIAVCLVRPKYPPKALKPVTGVNFRAILRIFFADPAYLSVVTA